jgi:uncharacterized protein involved in exopolysaccharide biosynthesis
MAFGADQGQLQDFLGILRKRRWQVLLPAALVLTLGTVFAVLVPKKFVVATTVEIRPERLETDYILKNPEATSTATEVQNAENHIKHFYRIKAIIDEQVAMWPEYAILNEGNRHVFVKNVMKSLRVFVKDKRKDRGSTFIEITYKDVSKERAQQFLTKVTEKWINEVVERDKNNLRGEKDVIQNQVTEAENEWQRLNRQYIDLCKQMEIDPRLSLGEDHGDRDKDPYFRDLDDTRRELELAKQEQALIVGRLEELRRQLDETPPEVAVPVVEKGVDLQSQILGWETEIAELRHRLEPITPAHTQYAIIERQIEGLNARILEAKALEREGHVTQRWEPNPRLPELRGTLELNEVQLKGLNNKVDELASQIAAKSAKVLARNEDYRDLFDVYERRELARQLRAEKGRELEDKRYALEYMTKAWGQPFDIVEVPKATDEPTEPNAALIITVAALIGIAIGLGNAMLSELFGNSYRSASELARVMAVPVLGTINTILTSSERRRIRVRRSMVGVSTMIVILGLAWFTWTWSTNPSRLPVQLQKAIEDFRLRFLF